MTTLKVVDRMASNFKSIQQAIDEANEGDIIKIEPDFYDEDKIIINKPLRIKGIGKRQNVNLMNGISIQTHGKVQIENVTIKGAASGGIDIIHGDVHINHCHIQNNKKHGITVFKHTQLLLENSTVEKNDIGINVLGTATIDSTLFTENNGVCQIRVGENGHTDIFHTTVENGQRGVGYVKRAKGTIHSSNIHSNKDFQLTILEQSAVSLIESTISSGRHKGIFIKRSNAKLDQCEISEHLDTQIHIEDNSIVHLEHSNIHHGQKGAVFIHDSDVKMNDCDIYQHGTTDHSPYQIYCCESSKFQLHHSTVREGTSGALQATEQSNIIMKNCTIVAHKDTQMVFRKECSVTIENSTIKSGSRSGLSAQLSTVNVIDSTFLEHEKPQLYITEQTNLHVKNCQIAAGKSNGIFLTEQSYGNIESSDISEHFVFPQMYIKNSELNMTTTEIKKSDTYGIFVTDHGKAHIKDSQINDNNGLSQVELATHSTMTLERCHVSNGAQYGLRATKSIAYIQACEFTNNGLFSNQSVAQLVGRNQARLHINDSTFANGLQVGIRIENHTQSVIENCSLSNHAKTQIEVTKESSLAISNSTIENGASGLYLFNSETDVKHCIFKAHQKAQVTLHYSQLCMRHSKVFSGETYGIYVQNASHALVEHSHIYDHQSEPQMYVEKSELHLNESELHHGKSYGILLNDRARAYVSDSTIHHHELAQLCAENRSLLTLNDSRLYDGASFGCLIINATANIDRADLSTHNNAQLAFKESSDGTLHNSKVHKGQTNGLVIRNKAIVQAENCQFHNHVDGDYAVITVQDTASLTIMDSKIYDNNTIGLLLHTTNKALVEYCYLYDNTDEHQVEIRESNNVILRGNRITNGKSYGISIVNAHPVIEKCFIEGHEKGAIHSDKLSTPFLTDNELHENDSPKERSAIKKVTKRQQIKPNNTTIEAVNEQKLNKLIQQLESYIGLTKVKEKITEFMNTVEVHRERERRGLIANTPVAPHIVFSGNPGTGKTTIARLMGQIFKEMNLLPEGQLVEVKREDLVGEFVGHTEKNTKTFIKDAIGGVLFIDEAYTLAQSPNGSTNDFGKKVIDTLVPAMEEHRGELMVIVAGYTKEMEQFLASNPGLKDRFIEKFHFDDYDPHELLHIFHKVCEENGYMMNEAAEAIFYKEITELYRKRDRTFSNARLMRNMFESMSTIHSSRIASMPRDEWDDDIMVTIVAEDVEKLLQKEHQTAFDVPINEALLEEKLAELNQLIGLDNVKQKINELVELNRYYKREGRDTKQLVNHMLLVGNPGTGKTEVARILAGIYEGLGLLERGELIEVDRTGLVDKYRGGTEIKTKRQIEQALGSTLFIDEAYALTNKDRHDPGHTAVEVLLKHMSDLDGEFMVIAAGYQQEMKQFLESNSGLARRFGDTLVFHDYTPEQLIEITHLYLNDYELSKDAEATLREHYTHLYDNRNNTFGNAGLAKKIATECIKNVDYRMSQLPEDKLTEKRRRTIERADVQMIER